MDPEAYEAAGGSDFAFSEKSVRRGFVKKVYGILTVQLVITLALISIFVFVDKIQVALRENSSIFWVPFGLSIAFLLFLICVPNLRRKTPFNFIFLMLFTLCEGITIGAICSTYDAQEVVIAVVATIAVVGGLTLFAFQTKIDFTLMSGMLFALLMVLITFGIFAIIFNNKVLTIFYYSLGALIFSLYIVVDTQFILGGKHKVSISPEEYIFAALNLYLDIINLFLILLALIGGRF